LIANAGAIDAILPPRPAEAAYGLGFRKVSGLFGGKIRIGFGDRN
jgi:hypothetical protein